MECGQLNVWAISVQGIFTYDPATRHALFQVHTRVTRYLAREASNILRHIDLMVKKSTCSYWSTIS